MNDLEDWSFTWMADLKWFCLDRRTSNPKRSGFHHHHDGKAKEIIHILRDKHKSSVSQ